jgi:hypothetical protein
MLGGPFGLCGKQADFSNYHHIIYIIYDDIYVWSGVCMDVYGKGGWTPKKLALQRVGYIGRKHNGGP